MNTRCNGGPGNHSRKVDIAAGTASSPPSLGIQTAVGDMSDLFLWRIREKAYTKRAEECRQLAKICPEHLRQGYLDLAAEYEQLAEKTPQIVQRASYDKED